MTGERIRIVARTLQHRDLAKKLTLAEAAQHMARTPIRAAEHDAHLPGHHQQTMRRPHRAAGTPWPPQATTRSVIASARLVWSATDKLPNSRLSRKSRTRGLQIDALARRHRT